VVRLEVGLHDLQLVMLKGRPHPFPAHRTVSASGGRGVVPGAVTASAAAARAVGVVMYRVIAYVTRHPLAALIQRCQYLTDNISTYAKRSFHLSINAIWKNWKMASEEVTSCVEGRHNMPRPLQVDL